MCVCALFVAEDQMPRLCVFCPAYLLKHIRDFGAGLVGVNRVDQERSVSMPSAGASHFLFLCKSTSVTSGFLLLLHPMHMISFPLSGGLDWWFRD